MALSVFLYLSACSTHTHTHTVTPSDTADTGGADTGSPSDTAEHDGCVVYGESSFYGEVHTFDYLLSGSYAKHTLQIERYRFDMSYEEGIEWERWYTYEGALRVQEDFFSPNGAYPEYVQTREYNDHDELISQMTDYDDETPDELERTEHTTEDDTVEVSISDTDVGLDGVVNERWEIRLDTEALQRTSQNHVLDRKTGQLVLVWQAVSDLDAQGRRIATMVDADGDGTFESSSLYTHTESEDGRTTTTHEDEGSDGTIDNTYTDVYNEDGYIERSEANYAGVASVQTYDWTDCSGR